MANSTYKDLDGTNFPDKVDSWERFLDPTIETQSAINKYYGCINSGDFDGAAQIIKETPKLKQMIINANMLNQLRDAIIAVERYCNGIDSSNVVYVSHEIENVKKRMDNVDSEFEQEKANLEAKNTELNNALKKQINVGASITTTFNSDGSITETGDNFNKKTVFNSDGNITETYVIDGVTYTKTITFNQDGTIKEVVK